MRPWAADSIVVRPVGFAGYGQATSTGVRDITADSDATTYGAGVRYKVTIVKRLPPMHVMAMVRRMAKSTAEKI